MQLGWLLLLLLTARLGGVCVGGRYVAVYWHHAWMPCCQLDKLARWDLSVVMLFVGCPG